MNSVFLNTCTAEYGNVFYLSAMHLGITGTSLFVLTAAAVCQLLYEGNELTDCVTTRSSFNAIKEQCVFQLGALPLSFPSRTVQQLFALE